MIHPAYACSSVPELPPGSRIKQILLVLMFCRFTNVDLGGYAGPRHAHLQGKGTREHRRLTLEQVRCTDWGAPRVTRASDEEEENTHKFNATQISGNLVQYVPNARTRTSISDTKGALEQHARCNQIVKGRRKDGAAPRPAARLLHARPVPVPAPTSASC